MPGRRRGGRRWLGAALSRWVLALAGCAGAGSPSATPPPTAVAGNAVTCGATHQNIGGNKVSDYSPHHEPFQYYKSTANPLHRPPTAPDMIGKSDQANHQYDLQDFFEAASAGNLPAVSFLKAQAFQDGHAGYSDPLDVQTFLVNTINFLESLPTWNSTAVVILYDDSDGWYDHQMGPIVNTSTGPADALTGPDACGTAATALPGLNPSLAHALGRCGYGPRQPLLVIWPYARRNFVDHTVTDQTSIFRFIEDNWLAGERIGSGSFGAIANSITQMFNFDKLRHNGVLFLNPSTGEKEQRPDSDD